MQRLLNPALRGAASMHSCPRSAWGAMALGLAIAAAGIPDATAQPATQPAASSVPPPQVFDEAWQIELVEAEPNLVTPVSCRFDHQGRLLVVECHTHFPPEDYAGPASDRIYRYVDLDGDGVVDERQLFFEGGTATMGLAVLPDDSLIVATRERVTHVRDADDDGKGESVEVLLRLETSATYPHNGLSGLVLGDDGWLYVGQGENLGEPYELIGTDGRRQIGGGEGGNVFRCRIDGTELERHATGFWNPFGLCFDSHQRLWTVGNDPDEMPPCRLVQIVRTGDYGFQFRFGRAGTHPLQAWNGELPGTLPMAAGTGEAPCAVLEHDGALWVTSWGSNRIERYSLTPQGASLTGATEVVVQGGSMFRPVDMAVAPDGSIYVTDWVDRSYPVHGKGRLWRLSRRSETTGREDSLESSSLATLRPEEVLADSLAGDAKLAVARRVRSLDHDDPFIRQAAIAGLVDLDQLADVSRSDAATGRQQVGLLSAWRWLEMSRPEKVDAATRDSWIGWGLAADEVDVQRFAVRWAAERNLTALLPEFRARLGASEMNQELFEALIGAIVHLEGGTARRGRRDPVRERLLYEFAAEPANAVGLRATAIRLLSAESELPTADEVFGWVGSGGDRKFGGESVRFLAARGQATDLQVLAKLAAADDLPEQVRADAAEALAPQAATFAKLLDRLSRPNQPSVVRESVKRVSTSAAARVAEKKPAPDDLAGWIGQVGTGGDPEAGRRVFFRTTCATCHAHSGRGATVGPDLTTLGGSTPRERILESILLPAKEVGPMYVPWRVLTVDGRIVTGMRLDAAGVGKSVRFLAADGSVFELPLEEIEQQSPAAESIMPSGLHETMTIDELRDLLAFLEQGKH